jgi:hypothetical protein
MLIPDSEGARKGYLKVAEHSTAPNKDGVLEYGNETGKFIERNLAGAELTRAQNYNSYIL